MPILSRVLMIMTICAGLQLEAHVASAYQYSNSVSPDAGTNAPGPTDPNGPPSL